MSLRFHYLVLALLLLAPRSAPCEEPDTDRYLDAVRRFAQCVLQEGRDAYGVEKTPLFVDGLHVETLEPVRWECRGETWVLSNFASHQPLLRLLDGLTALTDDDQYRKAAEDATRCALKRLRTPNGLLYWGGHLAWDLDGEKPVGQSATSHELKNHQPYYELMWRVDPVRTRELIETIWGAHVLDWSLLDYNRHGHAARPVRPQWDHAFTEDTQVPFPTEGGNLSFTNVTPPLLHGGVSLAVLDDDPDALRWSRRLLLRWHQGRHPTTGLCGGQLSYRQHDRAQDALGHVHPDINEARIVGSYHQVSRYHLLPLAQMQAAERLIASGGDRERVGRELLQWASEDLKTYSEHCFDAEQGRFVAVMIDGTPLKWWEARTGYYVPESFAPRAADGYLLWGYCTAYRLTGDEAHWRMARAIASQRGLGDLGQPNGDARSLDLDTDCHDWRAIHALLELDAVATEGAFRHLARRIADNLLSTQTPTGLFPRSGRVHARTGDEIPLALLHLIAAIQHKRPLIPPPTFDRRFFHCEYHGDLAPHQQKRADARTYDDLVFYGSD